MSSQVKTCTHIKVTGVRCGSPALRGEQFCYFHQRMLGTVKAPSSRLHHVALLENEEAIQASLMEVVNALIRGTIELKRGELILRALNTAVRNIRHARFDIDRDHMVKEVPDYAAAEPGETGISKVYPPLPTSAELAAFKAEYMAVNASQKKANTAAAATAPTPTPASPPRPVSKAAPSNGQVEKATVPTTSKTHAGPDATTRKPPASDRSRPAPKERQECSPQPALSEAEGRKLWVSPTKWRASPEGAKENAAGRKCTGPSGAQTARAFRMTRQGR